MSAPRLVASTEHMKSILDECEVWRQNKLDRMRLAVTTVLQEHPAFCQDILRLCRERSCFGG